jgi:hypothetical protein
MPDYVEVASGLRKGDQVIVSDRSGLKAGQAVRSKPQAAISYEANAQQ